VKKLKALNSAGAQRKLRAGLFSSGSAPRVPAAKMPIAM
jgi:hypothetical protein